MRNGRTGVTALTSTGEGRRLSIEVHGTLRAMILDGELPPDSVVLQAEMARRLGVSRTPMREAFRLLQEEGLIDAAPDQRARVRGLNPEDVDSLYGARIMLETLAVNLTVNLLGEEDFLNLERALDEMRVHAKNNRPRQWYAAHHRFHATATRGVGPQLQKEIETMGEQSERFIRIAQLGIQGAWQRAQFEHEALCAAMAAKDLDEACRVISSHLARTALSVMAEATPTFEPVATRAALRLVTDGVYQKA